MSTNDPLPPPGPQAGNARDADGTHLPEATATPANDSAPTDLGATTRIARAGEVFVRHVWLATQMKPGVQIDATMCAIPSRGHEPVVTRHCPVDFDTSSASPQAARKGDRPRHPGA